MDYRVGVAFLVVLSLLACSSSALGLFGGEARESTARKVLEGTAKALGWSGSVFASGRVL